LRTPLEQLTRALDYSFRDIGLLERALTHRSAASLNNERLEYLGDALLDFFTAEALYFRFEQADEGQLSRLRAVLVKKDSLAVVARSLNLGDYLKLGAGELSSGGHARDSILADATEAILAAVYLDGGMDAAKRVMLRLFQPKLEEVDPEQALKDPKTRLQEYLQAHKHPLPEYGILETSGSQHQQRFKVFCRVPDLDLEQKGTGTSRRRAEQQAARNMLTELQRSGNPHGNG
jgi:ribonuclease-3